MSCPRSRSKIRRLLALLVSAFALAIDAGAQERSLRIRDFDAHLTVQPNGSLDVTERLTFGFTGEWNGIIRDLSLQHNTAQGRREKLDVDVVSITDATGQPLRVEEERKDGGWTRGLRIWIPGARDADRQIVIRYRVANAIRFYFKSSDEGEFDELYWNVTGNSWTMPIDKVRARVALPDGVTPTRTAVYTGGSGSTASDATIVRNGNELDFTLQRGLSPYEGMTIGVGWPGIDQLPTERGGSAGGFSLPVVAAPDPFSSSISFSRRAEARRDPKKVVRIVTSGDGTSPAELARSSTIRAQSTSPPLSSIWQCADSSASKR